MEIVAQSTFIRQTPRKLRLVAGQVRGLTAEEAVPLLENLDKKAARTILLVLKQGIGNAVNNFNLDRQSLKIKSLEINKGPIYKRWRFASHGRVHSVQKKTGHIKMVLEGKESEEKVIKSSGKKERKNKKEKKNGTKS